MRVAIMTWFHYHNYGTALQVTALKRKIEQMSHKADVINYIPRGRVVNFARKHSLIKRVYNKVFAKKIPEIPYLFEGRERIFEDFLNNNLTFTQKCTTLSDLEDLNYNYDAFVCGSDQIWSPYCFDMHYYLDFVREPNKMIAYAPSMGTEKIKDKSIDSLIKKYAARFRYISTREENASKMIGEMIGRNVSTVLDPTLLLSAEEWTEMLKIKERTDFKPYLLVYLLGKNEEHWNLVETISQRTELPIKIIPVFNDDIKRPGCITEPIGPKEFVELIKNAGFVCTDSFHGTAFSLIFQKKFCTFERFKKNDPKNQNLRIYNILDALDLRKLLVRMKNDIAAIDNIDYSAVNKKINHLKEESLQFLRNALNEMDMKEENPKKKHIRNNSSLCCGCGACASICPVSAVKIIKSESGFFSAQIDESKCILCGRCNGVCPFYKRNESKDVSTGTLYSYKSDDARILERSSSGGFAYVLSKHLLNKGWDVAGCMFDSVEQLARHILLTPDESDKIYLLQGSKYMQSDFFVALEKIIDRKKTTVIIGTPCQIAGAKKVLKDREDILYVDLICHGVPSYLLYDKYKQYMNRRKGINCNCMNVCFRYKPKGWQKKYICVSDDEKTISNNQKEDYYLRMFELGHCYMPACYECRWRDKTDADIRIGDYWGKRFSADDTGVSIVLAMTDKGKKTILELERTAVGEFLNQPLEDYLSVQQIINLPKPVFYDELIKELRDGKISFTKIIKKYAKPFEKQMSGIEKILRKCYKYVQK